MTTMIDAPEVSADQQQKDHDAAIVQEVIQKRDSYPAAWKDIYKECKEHEEFVLMGKQMDAGTLRKYGFPMNSKQPNLLKTYVNNQANQTLQAHYHPVISPNGGGSDITKARMREDVLRGIQRNGGPQTFNQARRGQLAGGIHYSRVIVDYASDRGFQKEFRYEDVTDTYNFFPDPQVITSTFSDMRDFLIKDEIPRSMWKERTGMDWTYGQEQKRTLWYYWKKKSVSTQKEYIMDSGEEMLESDLPMGEEGPDMSSVQMEDDGITPYSRDVSMYEWEWYMVQDTSKDLMKSGTWLGCFPPCVACTGEKVVEQTTSGAKVHYYPLTRDAEEPQLLYTILENIIKLRLGRSPYSKWKIAFESVILKQSQEYRDSAVTGDFDVLYRSYMPDGKAIPAPEEMEPHILDKVLIELQQVQEDKIKRILGIFDDSLGKQTQAKSGIAVERLTAQSDLSSYHFEFNFLEYIKQMGVCTLEAFPKYLTAPQQIAFVDKDDKAVMQMINTPDGIMFDPNEKYSLVVEVSPDSDTDREAEADGLKDMIDNPFLGPAIAKIPGAMALIVKAQKGRYAQQLGEMMEQAANDPQAQQMQQQFQQAQQVISQLKQQLTQQNLKLQGKGDQASLDAMKENNRHLEAISKLRLDADGKHIEAFDADTRRMAVDMKPQLPESLPV